MPLRQQSTVYPASYQQHDTLLLPTSHHHSTASLPLSHQQHGVSMPLGHQPQTASLPVCHQQHAGYRSASFVDSNPAFQDLSESFKSLYKTVFETPQGTSTLWTILFICFLLALLATPLNMQASIFGACPKPGLKWEGCGRKGIRHKNGGWRWVATLFSPDEVAPIQIVGASASVIFLCTIKSRRISALYMCACGLFTLFVFAYLSYLYFSFFLFYVSYLLFYLVPSRIWTRSVSRPEVVGGDWTWV